MLGEGDTNPGGWRRVNGKFPLPHTPLRVPHGSVRRCQGLYAERSALMPIRTGTRPVCSRRVAGSVPHIRGWHPELLHAVQGFSAEDSVNVDSTLVWADTLRVGSWRAGDTVSHSRSRRRELLHAVRIH